MASAISAAVVVAKAGLVLTEFAGERCLGTDRDLLVAAATEDEADPIHRLFTISRRRDFVAVTADMDSDVVLALSSLHSVGAVVALTFLVVLDGKCRASTSLCRIKRLLLKVLLSIAAPCGNLEVDKT